MPHRVPGGNLVGRMIGLGNLDKVERQRDMRRAYRQFDRPIQTETDRRVRLCFNDRNDLLRMPTSRYAHHEPFIPDGLPPGMDERRRQCGDLGLRHPGWDLQPPARRVRQPDVDDWSHERIMNYLCDHEEGIKRYKKLNIHLSDGRRFPYHSEKWWVRNYHEYMLKIQQQTEDWLMEQNRRRGHGRRRRVLDEERSEFGDDAPHGYHGRRSRHEDEDDDDDDDY